MSERDALYQAVLAAPADDAPRLVFADWLDDHGDPDKAKLIRIQCELEKEQRLYPRDEPRITELEAMLSVRVREQSRDWEAPSTLPDYVFPRGLKRGFANYTAECESIEEVAALQGLVSITDLIVRNIPVQELIEHLRMAEAGDKAGQVLKHITELTIRGYQGFDRKDGERLAESASEWQHLQSLELDGRGLTYQGMQALARASFPELRTFSVRPALHQRTFEETLRPLRHRQMEDPSLPVNHPHLQGYTPTPLEVETIRARRKERLQADDKGEEAAANPRRRIGPQRADGSRVRGGGERTP